MYHRATDLA